MDEKKSGRYPMGSGKRPENKAEEVAKLVQLYLYDATAAAIKEGISLTDIADGIKIGVNDFTQAMINTTK